MFKCGKGFFTKMMVVVLTVTFLGGSMTDTIQAASKYADISEYESLAKVYEDKFSIGVAVQAISHWNDSGAEIGNPDKEEIIKQQFNSITFGNEFKPAYNFDPKSETLFSVDHSAKELLDWAKANKIKVRGHVLVWHSQVNPDFFAKDFNALSGGKHTTDWNAELDEDCLVSADELRERLKTYIYGAMEFMYKEGYADTIYAWDVVNEASDENEDDCLRRSTWYRILGKDFLYYSFLYAREAEDLYSVKYAEKYDLDPASSKDDLSSIRPWLFYNDYNEWFPKRCDGIINFLTKVVYNKDQSLVKSDSIKADGDGTIYGDGLIDGIGMQAHMSDAQNVEECRTALKKYAAAINNIEITELDVNQSVNGAKGAGAQAAFYNEYFKMLLEEKTNGANITNVTFWGLTDTSSWRADAEPLIFYQYLERKPSYFGVLAAGKGEEFNVEDYAMAAGEAKDTLIDFEPYKDGSTMKTVVPADAGFHSRGAGHQSRLELTHNENHTEGAPVGFSLIACREEKDATVRMSASQYIGHKLTIKAWYKTADKLFRMGIDGLSDSPVVESKADGNWNEAVLTVNLPKELKACDVYFETDGKADIYLDDIEIKVDDESEKETLAGVSDENKEEVKEASSVSSAAGEEKTEVETKGRTVSKLPVMMLGGVALLAVVACFMLVLKRKK